MTRDGQAAINGFGELASQCIDHVASPRDRVLLRAKLLKILTEGSDAILHNVASEVLRVLDEYPSTEFVNADKRLSDLIAQVVAGGDSIPKTAA